MIDEMNEMQSENSSKVVKTQKNNNFEHRGGANAKRKRLLALLKARYGYTNEKAADELTRLMKKFNITVKSPDTRHTRPDFQYPHAR